MASLHTCLHLLHQITGAINVQDYEDYNALLKTYNKAKTSLAPDSDDALHLSTLERLVKDYAKNAFAGF